MRNALGQLLPRDIPGQALVIGLWNLLRRMWVFPASERLEFYENMAKMCAAKIVVKDALAEIVDGNARVGRRFAHFYRRLLYGYSGQTLAALLHGWLPFGELMVLSAGERSSPVEGFRAAAKVARNSGALWQAVLGATLYPAVLLVTADSVVRGIAVKLVPQAIKMRRAEPMPPEAQAFVDFAQFVDGYSLYLWAGFGALCLLVAWSLPRWTGPGRGLFDRYCPPYILYRYVIGSSMLMSMAALCRTSMPLKDVLLALIARAQPYAESHLRQILAVHVGGEGDHLAFHTGLFPPSIVIRIAALARSGSLADSLVESGDDAAGYTLVKVKQIGALFTFSMMILVGGIVAWMIIFYNAIGSSAAALAPH